MPHTSSPGALQSLAGDPASVRAALVDVDRDAPERGWSTLEVRDESATLAALARSRRLGDLARLRLVLAVTDTFHPAQVPFLRRLASSTVVSSSWRSCRHRTNSALIDQSHAFGSGEVPDARATAVAATVISCPDPDEEVRHAVRQCAEPDRRGVPADRHRHRVLCAVLSTPGPRRAATRRDRLVRAAQSNACTGPWPAKSCATSSTASSANGTGPMCSACWRWHPSTPSAISARRAGSGNGPRCAEASAWSPKPTGHGPRTRSSVRPIPATALGRCRSRGDPRRAADGTRRRPTARRWTRLLKLVERLRQQSQKVRKASTWEGAVKALNAILLDHIGAPTWRERAWADGPAWQRNAADHVERIVCRARRTRSSTASQCRTQRPPCARSSARCSTRRFAAAATRPGRCRSPTSPARRASTRPMCSSSVSTRACCRRRPSTTCCSDATFPNRRPRVIEGPRALASRAERAWHALLHSDARITATLARTDLRRGGRCIRRRCWQAWRCSITSRMRSACSAPMCLDHVGTVGRRHRLASRVAAPCSARELRCAPDWILGRPSTTVSSAPTRCWRRPTSSGRSRLSRVRRSAASATSVNRCCGISEETDAATILSIEPAERGVLVHAVFEQLINEWLAIEPDHRPPWLVGDHLPAMQQRALECLDELAESIGIDHRLGHASAWRAERAHILRSIVATLEAEAADGIATRRRRARLRRCRRRRCVVRWQDRPHRPVARWRAARHRLQDQCDRVDANPLDDGRTLQFPLYARAADHDRAVADGEGRRLRHPPRPATSKCATARRHERGDAARPDVIAEFETYVRDWLDEIEAADFVAATSPCERPLPDVLRRRTRRRGACRAGPVFAVTASRPRRWSGDGRQ